MKLLILLLLATSTEAFALCKSWQTPDLNGYCDEYEARVLFPARCDITLLPSDQSFKKFRSSEHTAYCVDGSNEVTSSVLRLSHGGTAAGVESWSYDKKNKAVTINTRKRHGLSAGDFGFVTHLRFRYNHVSEPDKQDYWLKYYGPVTVLDADSFAFDYEIAGFDSLVSDLEPLQARFAGRAKYLMGKSQSDPIDGPDRIKASIKMDAQPGWVVAFLRQDSEHHDAGRGRRSGVYARGGADALLVHRLSIQNVKEHCLVPSGSQSVTIQSSYCDPGSADNIRDDETVFSMTQAQKHHYSTRYQHIVARNSGVNMTDFMHANSHSKNNETGDLWGLVINNNDMWWDSRADMTCGSKKQAGRMQVGADCACRENAIDLKMFAGTAERLPLHHVARITRNRVWGGKVSVHRRGHECAYAESYGTAFVAHYSTSRSLLFADNVVFDYPAGLFRFPAKKGSTLGYYTIQGNLFHNSATGLKSDKRRRSLAFTMERGDKAQILDNEFVWTRPVDTTGSFDRQSHWEVQGNLFINGKRPDGDEYVDWSYNTFIGADSWGSEIVGPKGATPQGWRPNSRIRVNDIVIPSGNCQAQTDWNCFLFMATREGVSGDVEPEWSKDSRVVDGSVELWAIRAPRIVWTQLTLNPHKEVLQWGQRAEPVLSGEVTAFAIKSGSPIGCGIDVGVSDRVPSERIGNLIQAGRLGSECR